MKYFISLFIILSLGAEAQSPEFAPVGTKWWYRQGDFVNPFFQSYSTIESTKDTVVANQSCRKLVATLHYYLSEYHETKYMYGEDRKIFYYSPDSMRFLQLYDFNKEAGDSFIIEGYQAVWNGIRPLTAYVDSVGTIDINSTTLKTMYTHSLSMGDNLEGMSIEGIGNVYWMLPFGDNFTTGPLRCYEDANLGLYETGIDPACDYTAAVNEIAKNELFHLYPNPVFSTIFIEGADKNYTIAITDEAGKILLSQNMSGSMHELNVSFLTRGIYFLQIMDENGIVIRKFVKQ